MDKKKKIVIGISLLTIMFVGVLTTFAYFNTVGSTKKTTANLTTGTMALEFADNDNGINTKLSLGESVTKKFIIKNTGTLEASLSMDFYKLYNSYTDGSLTYTLEYSETEDGEYTELLPKTNVPVTNIEINHPIMSEISVPAGTNYYYNLTITFNDLDENQIKDVDAEFHTNFSVNQPLKYRYYNLSINPAGGTWNEYTSTQEYKLQNKGTMEIPNPTREGYTFSGWSIKGVSSTIEDNTFSMGISDTTITAEWTPNKYKLIVNLDGGTITSEIPETLEYGSSIELSNPSKEGYTFTGWSALEGVLQGNTLTQNITEGITLTANYQINNYKYIVYHHKQNVSGEGYTLVEADTDEGEAEFNSTVRPEVKVYTGFTSPNIKPLTIQAETVYPPEKNKVDYNYGRNKHTFTVNLNGGNSTDTYPSELYYEQEIELGIPEKVGYNFTNWSKTSGTLTDNIFKMDNTETTLTANYTPKEYTVTFNANGGVVSTQSKLVTYDNTYGTLPEPTREGYTFNGWYTELTQGSEITSNTQVKISENQMLYAHWKVKLTSKDVLDALNLSVNEGNPNFARVATTDEGIYAMEDDYGTSYYFRGAAENNYVKFAGFYWRIIRINGDGSLRIIYDGTRAWANGEISQSRSTGMKTKINDLEHRDYKYAGYMYGGLKGEASTSDEQAQTNETDSDFKSMLEYWYQTNIENKGFSNVVADSIFCNDRSTKYYSGRYTYEVDRRLMTDKLPTFKCKQDNDKFTTKNATHGNKATNYPVGLITADEVVTAGGSSNRLGGNALVNKNYYLYKGVEYWTMSPMQLMTMFVVGDFHGSLGWGSYTASIDLVPVINLTPEYVLSLTGDGTISNSFRESGVKP